MDASVFGFIIPIVVTIVVLASVVPMGFWVFKLLTGMHQQAKDEQRILATGHPAQGRIMAAQQTGTLVNNNPQVIFTIQVIPQGGQAYQTQLTKIVPLFEMARYQVGANVDLRVDPANPMKVAIAPAAVAMAVPMQQPWGGGPSFPQ